MRARAREAHSSRSEGAVARFERSEIRGRFINAATPCPGFAGAQCGLRVPVATLTGKRRRAAIANPNQSRSVTAALTIIAAVTVGVPGAYADAALRPYVIVGDAIPASLTGAPGDPVRGKAIVSSRQTGLCLLCHSAPLSEEKFQGTIGPDLKGVGSRNTEGQLRLRIVDPRIFNPDTIMPAYYRRVGLTRVAPAFRGKTVLTAEEIEDVVAFLMTLRD